MYAKAYVKRGKSDAVDAAAICKAVTRPTMRFVAIKSEAQQGVLFLHRARDLIVRQRTQLINMLRALLAEFGIVIAQGVGSAIRLAKQVLDGERPRLPEVALDVLHIARRPAPACHLVRAEDGDRGEDGPARGPAAHNSWRGRGDGVGDRRHGR